MTVRAIGERSPAASTPPSSSSAVDEFVARLDHPSRAAIGALRELVLGVDPAIAEGIQWNAPSFRTSDCFAIDDPEKLLRWLLEDRAMIEIASSQQLTARRAALQSIVRPWIRQL